jgi:hypothetical protein
MKKNLFLILFLAVSVIANAAITSGANFQLLATTSGATDDLLLLEDDTYALSDQDQSATKFTNHSNPTSVNLYVSDIKLGILAQLGTSSLKNTPLTIETNENETSYKIKLLGMAPGSRALKLYDLEANNGSAPVAEFTSTDVEYPFTAPANSVIIGRFYIDYDASVFVTSVTTNEYGWASFSYNADLTAINPALVIYKGAINGEYLDLTAVDYVPNGQGVLVKGEANTTYYFAAGNGSASFAGNDLKATATYNTSMKNVFVLKGNAFLEYIGTNALAANKAYIQLPSAGPNNAPKRITMRFNEAQGVESIKGETVNTEKFVENGQVYIRRGNEVYNLQGQIIK